MSGLRPDGDEGRALLRRELLRPEYNQENPVLRLLDWLLARLDDGLGVARTVDPLVAAAAMVVLLALGVGIALLVGRARTDRRAGRPGEGVLDDVVESATELRARAEAARAAGRHEDALLDGFRALARRGVELGRLPDSPGATAREIAATLGAARPARADDVRRAAALFDGVRYGAQRVGADEVADVLRLDDDLVTAR